LVQLTQKSRLDRYLITTLLRIEFDQTEHINLKNFYIRRTLRIFPPLYLTLIVGIILTLVRILPEKLTLSGIFSEAFYWSNYYEVDASWHGIPSGTIVFWSLAVEEHFYLVFPFFYLLLRRYLPSRFHQMLVLLGICAIILLWRCILVYGFHSLELRTRLATDTRIYSLLFGCILAIYGNPVLDNVKYSARWLMRFWLPLGVVAILFTLVIRDFQFRETFRYTIQGIALLPIFITAIRYSDSSFFRLLNLRWIKFLGLISYSLYLVHDIVLSGLKTMHLNIGIQILLGLGLSISIATAIYYFIEKPCAALKKAWSS
uniref:acyltransferase family protein n=1 Tax=Aetokthonos hydrillicola TaxID=1550245 RepID=UPI001ABB55EE